MTKKLPFSIEGLSAKGRADFGKAHQELTAHGWGYVTTAAVEGDAQATGRYGAVYESGDRRFYLNGRRVEDFAGVKPRHLLDGDLNW